MSGGRRARDFFGLPMERTSVGTIHPFSRDHGELLVRRTGVAPIEYLAQQLIMDVSDRFQTEALHTPPVLVGAAVRQLVLDLVDGQDDLDFPVYFRLHVAVAHAVLQTVFASRRDQVVPLLHSDAARAEQRSIQDLALV